MGLIIRYGPPGDSIQLTNGSWLCGPSDGRHNYARLAPQYTRQVLRLMELYVEGIRRSMLLRDLKTVT